MSNLVVTSSYGPPVTLDVAKKIAAGAVVEANKNNWRVAIAIVDDQGELVSFARMDKCAAQPPMIARKKAYTAARTRSDTVAYAERLKSQGRSVTEFGDPNLIALQGGVVITNLADQSVLGGIGVSGLAAEEDEAIAKLGLKAITG